MCVCNECEGPGIWHGITSWKSCYL